MKLIQDIEPLVHDSGIRVPYNWWAGETASRFFGGLRDEKKIRGRRCLSCQKVFIPPRKTCPECFSPDMAWVDVSDEGTVQAFTVVRRQLAALKKPAPVIFGLIRLDGADTSMLHYLQDARPEEVTIGMRVRACYADQRTGHMLDILHFS
ncbi:MAG: Zn-ribbon domain-containing OB-fold protein, partial [Desulfatirhabdiaceae bacterium]